MAGYVHRQTSDYLAGLRKRQVIAQAELEHKRAELAQIRAAEQELARISAEQTRLDKELKAARTNPSKLPPPIHGGPAGLKAAAAEIAAWNAQHRDAA